jgi:hypothetical protein
MYNTYTHTHIHIFCVKQTQNSHIYTYTQEKYPVQRKGPKEKKNKRNRKYMNMIGKEPGHGAKESKNTSHMVKHTANLLIRTAIRLVMMMLELGWAHRHRA